MSSRSTTHDPLILAVDQGTTNTKALVVDCDGRVRGLHAEPVVIEFPQPGWAQSDPLDVWRSVERVITAALDQLSTGTVVGIAIANQRESVVAWERRTGAALGPLVSWQCTRGASRCAELQSPSNSALVAERTGLALDPMFSAAKMAWLLESIADGRRRADAGEICLGTVDSWLLWSLTGGSEFRTDRTNASRTLLADIESGDWNDDLLSLFGVPRTALPAIGASSDHFGTSTLRHPRLSTAGVPVAAMIGDSHAALVGHGAFAAGAVKASFGTGTSVMAPTDRIVHSPKLSTTIGWSRRVGDATEAIPAIEGNIYATGAALSWASELLGLADVSLLDTVAGRCADAGGVSFVPALAGLGAPHWDPEARGTITGITRHAGPPQIARAAMEAVAHQVADVVEEMRRILGRDVEALHTDGGAMRSELLSQVVADLVGVTVMRSDEPELAALGAASLAGLHVGLWRDLDALRELPRAVRHVAPSMGAAERLRRRAEWADAVARTCARVR